MSTLASNLNTVFRAFFELDENTQLSSLEFLDYAKQICTTKECDFLICVMHGAGNLAIGEHMFRFANDILYGLRVRSRALSLCKVTSVNFDHVYKMVANPVYDKQYQRVLAYRTEVAKLQIELAHLTFQIVSSDQERFALLKKRNKQIESVKRAVRRKERENI